MTDNYTPTTEALRDAWRRDRVWAFGAPAVQQRGAAESGFDLWLASIKADAWLEGYEAAADDLPQPMDGWASTPNPYMEHVDYPYPSDSDDYDDDHAFINDDLHYAAKEGNR